jgi:hypothetical protein
MVRQVLVDPAWRDGPRPDKGERRERVRVVERGVSTGAVKGYLADEVVVQAVAGSSPVAHP